LQPAHEKIGVVDSQWIVHQVVPSLGNQVRITHCVVWVSDLTIASEFAISNVNLFPSWKCTGAVGEWEGTMGRGMHPATLLHNDIFCIGVCWGRWQVATELYGGTINVGKRALPKRMGNFPDKNGWGGESVLWDDGCNSPKRNIRLIGWNSDVNSTHCFFGQPVALGVDLDIDDDDMCRAHQILLYID